jgi:hypothetical protein
MQLASTSVAALNALDPRSLLSGLGASSPPQPAR